MSISVSVILTVDLDETSNRTVKNPKVLNDLIEGIFAVRRTALIAFASKSNCRSALRGTVVRRILLRKTRRWWVEEDLNLRPHAYQACALTT